MPAISLFLLLVQLDFSLLVFGYSKRLCHVVAIGDVTTLCVLPTASCRAWGGGGAQFESKSFCKLLAGGYCSLFRKIFMAETVRFLLGIFFRSARVTEIGRHMGNWFSASSDCGAQLLGYTVANAYYTTPTSRDSAALFGSVHRKSFQEGHPARIVLSLRDSLEEYINIVVLLVSSCIPGETRCCHLEEWPTSEWGQMDKLFFPSI